MRNNIDSRANIHFLPQLRTDIAELKQLGFNPSQRRQIIGIVQTTHEGRMKERKRLEFARWLVVNGRLSDQIKD